MDKLRIASAVAALTSALALPAWGAGVNDGAKDRAANLDQPLQSMATQQATPAANDDTTAGAQDSRGAQATARKHPPTAAMDSATPNEKTTSDRSPSSKHPPTTAMDRAAPDQASPAPSAPDAASSGTSSPATKLRN